MAFHRYPHISPWHVQNVLPEKKTWKKSWKKDTKKVTWDFADVTVKDFDMWRLLRVGEKSQESLRRGHANLLCIVPILVYVLPKQAPQESW